MRITKLGHSCVLVETPDRVGLFDPGGWSDRELIMQVDRVDRIIYTHEHGDHFNPDLLRELLAKHPNAHVVCNDAIKSLIEEAGIDAVVRDETQCTRKFSAQHDGRLPILSAQPPEMSGYHFQGMFTHPGDTHDVNETMDVLAMPFVAPWGIPKDAIETVLRLKPKYVLPIHDWLYTDDAKKWLQSILEQELGGLGIKVLSPISGIAHTIKE